MVSVPKKYREQEAATNGSAPVTPAEPTPSEENPVRAAEQSALRERLQEMERADALKRQQQQPPQPEPQAQQPETPAHVQEWLSRHPEYMDPNDEIAQLEIYTAIRKCARDGKTQEDPDYLKHIERHLGIAPAANGQTESRLTPQPAAPPRPSAPRHVEPPRPQPQRNIAVSAPPTREVPSMSTGRSPRYRAPLTKDELEIAAACGQTPEEYQAQKERMMRMKANQEIQG